MSFYSATECFIGSVTSALRRHLDFTREASAETQHSVNVKTHISTMVSVSQDLQPNTHEAAAFETQPDRLTNLPRFVDLFYQQDARLQPECNQQSHATMGWIMLAITLNHLTDETDVDRVFYSAFGASLTVRKD